MDLSRSAGSVLPGRGLMNPAFSIKVVTANDSMQERPSNGRNNQSDDYLDGIKIGDSVTAKIKKKKVTGKVTQIIKNELGDGIYALVVDKNGKEHKIEGSLITKIRQTEITDDKAAIMSTPARFNESRFLSYNQF